MSLLTMIQDVAGNLGITRPSIVITSTDPTIITLLGLANKEGRELAGRYDWNALTKQASFTTTNANLQGTLVSIAGSGFKHIMNGTMWDQTHSRPIRGSISKQRWAQLESTNVAGTYSEHQIRNKSLYAIPAPGSTSAQWAFFYYSKYWCESSGGSGQKSWTADDDVGILDEDLMALGIEWRYLKSKGYDYSEEFMSYERRVQNDINQDRDHPVINLETSRFNDGPGYLGVPEGSWPAS
jgi:hypothetical protein